MKFVLAVKNNSLFICSIKILLKKVKINIIIKLG